VDEACFTFARKDWAGQLRTASEVHAISFANLDGEHCAVTATAEILAVLAKGFKTEGKLNGYHRGQPGNEFKPQCRPRGARVRDRKADLPERASLQSAGGCNRCELKGGVAGAEGMYRCFAISTS
jgi:hypothetical protein